MAVKIRLTRRGRKKLALYDIIAADARAARDGRFLEKLGNYNPHTHPATILLKEEKILQWLSHGAQPTHTVRNILSSQGILLRRHLQVGVSKGAIVQEEADKRWEAWRQARTIEAAKKGPKAFQEGKTQRMPHQSVGEQKETLKPQVPTQETSPASFAGKEEELPQDSTTPLSSSKPQ